LIGNVLGFGQLFTGVFAGGFAALSKFLLDNISCIPIFEK
jgi:hypothetical protein